jgi:hypothetical protein
MQVKVSGDGYLVIPPAIPKEVGIQPGTVMDVFVKQGILQALVVSPRGATLSKSDTGRLARLKPHPDAVLGNADDLDKAIVWDEIMFPLPQGNG